MKRYFYFGLGVMLTLIVTLIGYGAYLNQRDESQISERMSSRTIPLTGAKAQFKDNKQAQLTLENMYLQKNQMIEQKKSFEAQRDQLLLQSEYSESEKTLLSRAEKCNGVTFKSENN